MAIYKVKAGKKSASIRQGIYWGLWGVVAGIYALQPLLKAAHRDEKSILAAYLEEDEQKPQNQQPSVEQNGIKT